MVTDNRETCLVNWWPSADGRSIKGDPARATFARRALITFKSNNGVHAHGWKPPAHVLPNIRLIRTVKTVHVKSSRFLTPTRPLLRYRPQRPFPLQNGSDTCHRVYFFWEGEDIKTYVRVKSATISCASFRGTCGRLKHYGMLLEDISKDRLNKPLDKRSGIKRTITYDSE